jgi:ATP-binding cassette subfamily C protein
MEHAMPPRSPEGNAVDPFDALDEAVEEFFTEKDLHPRPARDAAAGAAGVSAPLIEGVAGGAVTASAADKPSMLHQKQRSVNFRLALTEAQSVVRRNVAVVFAFTLATNVLVLAVPIYLFQISDRVLTSRSLDTLLMLTGIVAAAVIAQSVLDVFRRMVLMRTAAEIETRLGSPILSAASRSALGGSGKDYQVLGDLQHIRSFITGPTLVAMLDAPLAPIFMLAVWMVHPHLGAIVVSAVAVLLVVAWLNKRATAQPFAEASGYTARSNMTLDALSRNSQIINALGMIPEVVRMWGRDNAASLGSQVKAQDLNVMYTGISKAARLLTQVTMLGWGAYLSLQHELTGGMVIASSIIASRALSPVEGTIEGWRQYVQSKTAYARIVQLLLGSPLNVERLRLPRPQGRLDVERVLYVPSPSKKVILNGISFSLEPGEALGIIGSSGAGKSTIGRMLVGSIVPTAGSVRLDLMDLKNWDPRQLGESIGYLPQDVQLFPATIKANIARMREDATDEEIFEAASLADVHELVASFPQGYETPISADGSPLSGGQKQRIGLARAFFGNPRLVVLDEPNSNLDTAGEMALAAAMTRAKKLGTTIVAITQRQSLLQCVDKIMVVEKGAVAAVGERDKMLAALAGRRRQEPALQAAE